MTPAQLTTLKAAIAANPTWNSQPQTADGAFAIAADMNTPSSPAFTVWRTDAPVSAIYDAITWTNYTPVDAPDATATFTNRALVIQTKQMNLQNLLQGRTTIDASKANTRAGLRDAVINLPAGAAGASVSAGGANGVTVLTACTRNATKGEQVLAGAPAQTGGVTANLLGFEGALTYQDILDARAS